MYPGSLGTVQSSTPRAKKERKVSILFRQSHDQKHCAGVESVLLVPNHKILFTASRDSTVKRWNIADNTPEFEASFEGHADWVNDIALVSDILISCSNDTTIRVWRGGSPGICFSALTYHTDYVTSLAASSARNLVASGGLRGEIFLLDLATGANLRLYPKQQPTPSPQQLQLQQQQQQQQQQYHGFAANAVSSEDGSAMLTKGSIYALAMNPAGTVLAAGTTEHIVRLWDPRTHAKVMKLRGHTDIVRALAVNAEGTMLLSGASDGSIKLWDLGMQRCVQTYLVHSDSVWCLQPSEDFSAVFSGGRDGCIYRTQLATRTAELMLLESNPIRKVAYDASEGALWVAMPSSSVNKWLLPKNQATATSGSESRFSAGRMRYLASTPPLRVRSSMERPRQPAIPSPHSRIPGIPGIVLHKVMNDRRHVLTKDAEGNVALWDVLLGGIEAAYGKVDFEAKERELFEARSVPSWFTSDTRLGALSITLEPPSCFLAEEYAMMLGYPNVSDDFKVNFGKLVLEGAFAKWKQQVCQQHAQPGSERARHFSSGSPMHVDPATAAAAGASSDQDCCYAELWPKYWRGIHPAVLCQTSMGQHWRLLIGQFTGQESEPDFIPTWVGDVVLRGANVTPKEAKFSFVLLPSEGSGLPSLLQSKLNAPRILQVHKVAHYCISKLQELDVVLDVRPVHVPSRAAPIANGPQQATTQATEDQVPAPGGRPMLELLCNGVAVPSDMSLATVKKYIWKKSDDLVFNYRVLDPNNPAPLPTLSPPPS